MKKRFLSFVLAGTLALLMAFDVLPMRARAVLPVGFVESAFASYAMSSGYSFFSEEMDDPLFLGLFRELYDDFVTIKSALGQSIRRWDEYDNRDVYLDRSGNIVVSYGVAQDWAGAMEWIQSHYEIEDGGDGVIVVPSVSGSLSVLSGSVSAVSYPFYFSCVTSLVASFSNGTKYLYKFSSAVSSAFFSSESGNYLIFSSSTPVAVELFIYRDTPNLSPNLSYSMSSVSLHGTSFYYDTVSGSFADSDITLNSSLALTDNLMQEISFEMLYGDILSVGTVSGLAVSIGSGVTDIAQGMADDDAVVIGVGAVPGISEGEIADFIADGIRADTLEPTATITAMDVIDTPVQPYPDIDGLGLPSLGAALTSRFPFCIPWDFVDTVQLLAADPVAPDFSFDLLPQRIRDYCHITASTEVRFNMGDPKFSKVGVFCRWGSLISFCFGLAVLTKRMIWTA